MVRALQTLAALVLLCLWSAAAPRAQAPNPPVQSAPLPPPAGAPAAPAETPPPASAAPAPPAAAPPAPPPPAAQATPPQQGADAFGEEVTVPAKTIVAIQGSGTWDSAFETLVDSFKSVYAFMEKEGLKAAGNPMTIYTSTDDTGFQYQAAVPIAAAPANLPKGDIEVTQSPGGKMLKFVHRGSYDAMDTTYEAITNYLDTKQLEAQDSFVEEYLTNPVSTPEDKLVVNVFVPIK
jgi:effector-binding domain-containing protein